MDISEEKEEEEEEEEEEGAITGQDSSKKHRSADEIIDKEISVGAGLASALQLLKKQGDLGKLKKPPTEHELLEVENEKRRRQGLPELTIYHKMDPEDPAYDHLNFDKYDEFGRLMNQTETFRKLSQRFHGKMPLHHTVARRIRQFRKEQQNRVNSTTDAAIKKANVLEKKAKKAGLPYVRLSLGNDRLASMQEAVEEEVTSLLMSKQPSRKQSRRGNVKK